MNLESILQPEMNGTDLGVMKSLLVSLPLDGQSLKSFEVSRAYMAELWARGVSKEDFLKWAEENKR